MCVCVFVCECVACVCVCVWFLPQMMARELRTLVCHIPTQPGDTTGATDQPMDTYDTNDTNDDEPRGSDGRSTPQPTTTTQHRLQHLLARVRNLVPRAAAAAAGPAAGGSAGEAPTRPQSRGGRAASAQVALGGAWLTADRADVRVGHETGTAAQVAVVGSEANPQRLLVCASTGTVSVTHTHTLISTHIRTESGRTQHTENSHAGQFPAPVRRYSSACT